jgi:uncharacterized membrane protein
VAWLHKLLLYFHILSAILSIGPFFLLFPLVGKLRTADASGHRAYIDTFRFAIQMAKHGGHVLVVTGILLVETGTWSWKTPWIVMTLIILISSLFFLARAFSPKLRKLNEQGHDKEKVLRALSRSIWIYLILLMAMLWLMVAKPSLWYSL